MAYLRSKPLPFRGTNFAELAKRVAHELGEDGWRGNFGLQFNEGGDRALVYIRYDIQVYNATYAAVFVQRRGWWELDALRRISLTFVDGPPPPAR